MKTYGLIGYPVKHSLSGLMHNAAFKELKIEAQYRLFEVNPEDLEDFLLRDKEIRDSKGEYFSMRDLSGFNITIPYKVRAKEILEKEFPLDDKEGLNQEAAYYVKLSGAINTVKREDNGLRYFNTDTTGFLKSLEQDLKFYPQGKSIMLIGCGGAGRAIIAALSWINDGAKKIYVDEINIETAESAKRHFLGLPQARHLERILELIDHEESARKILHCQLLVNASPLGMKEGDPSVIKKELLHKDLFVYDVVYNRETQLVKDAKEAAGPLRAVGGLGMLLYQGVAAFELWTGRKAPVELMRRALEEGLKECRKK
ncbi:MAG: shikimate dehydrogenase [Candidatus Omnitrophota bacterium]